MSKIKDWCKKIYGIFVDACVENADGCAPARSAMLVAGYLDTVISAMTAGTFFSALLLAMGAEDEFIGYVSMATTFCAIVQYISPLFWEHFKRRKSIMLLSAIINNFTTYVVITVIPFLPIATSAKLWLYFAATLLASLLSNFTSPAFTAWLMQSLPLAKRVNHTALASRPNSVLNVVTAFLASLFLDKMTESGYAWGSITPELTAIVILRAGAAVLVVTSICVRFGKIKEYPYESSVERVGLKMMLKPLSNVPFILAILIPCLYTFAGAVIGNFFSIHLISNVHMPYTIISLAGVISVPIIMLMTPVWSLFCEKFGWFVTFAVTFAGYLTAWLCNVFITADSQIFYYIAIVNGNIWAPGMTLVCGNMVYLRLPKAERTVYLSFYSIIVSAFSFLGQTIGTTFVKYTGDLHFTLFGLDICNLQLTSALAALLGIPLVIYTLFAKRAIEAAEKRFGKSDTESLE